jgi:hypothetical protein
LRVTEVGAWQVAPMGAPLHAKAMVPLKSSPGVNCKLNIADCPAFTDTESALAGLLTVNAGGALANTLTDCGEFGASSLTKRVSLRAPEKIGAKVTLTLQLALAAIVVVLHALNVLAKSAGLAPPAEIPEMCSGAAPEFVMVTLIAVLASPCVVTGKFTLVGVNFAAGPLDGCCAISVPTRVTKCGLPEALSVNVNIA